MIRTLMFASAIALSAPAVAQEASTPPEASASETTTTQAPAEAQTPAPAQDSATAGQPQAATSTQVAQVIDADFPAYDKDGNGELSQEEFSAWMLKLRAATPQQGSQPPEAELTAWAGAAFAQADTDKNKAVSKGELTTFLAG